MIKTKNILETQKDTVALEYLKSPNLNANYQSEADLENEFIKQLISQGYEFKKINNSEELESNLKVQIEKLNNVSFSTSEWTRFLDKYLLPDNQNHLYKTIKIHKDYIYSFQFDNGDFKNIKIIDKKNIHNNYLQVINQFLTKDDEENDNRYDVTILINGLPLVHVELKRRSQSLELAFNQCNRYKLTSMSKLYEYVQIFVISNGTATRYFANPTTKNLYSKKDVDSFRMTQSWADAKNNRIEDLVDFTKYFFAKHTILNILTKYCILNVDNKLMIMRPYQIAATERIINQIIISNNYKDRLASTESGGYIWHSTGSGKTLTSFKTAQIARDLDFVDKILFVVDRQDLDYQTMREFNSFQEGSANSNSSTKILTQQIESDLDDSKVIVTTIQKLSNFIKQNPKHEVYKKHVVLIFDECHRSQFGDMHQDIIKNFKKYNIFGFTGTPIFAQNATKVESTSKIIKNINRGSFQTKSNTFKTTEQLFGERLHSYTLFDAINDGNVLKFNYSEFKTFDSKENIKDKDVYDIAREEVFYSNKRIKNIVTNILDNYDSKTFRNGIDSYDLNITIDVEKTIKAKNKDKNSREIKVKQRINGFNAMLATQDVKLAKMYYSEFQKQIKERNMNFRIATIYSYEPNESYESDYMGYLEEDNESTDKLDKSSKEFLSEAIKDYNKMFGTSYDISGESFKNYYKDISQRVKNRELELLIVVNMFLTGFDAPCLNTLYVDKNLRMHGLIQAFSRTNRIINKLKTHGNIVSYRPLKDKLDDAIAIFSNNQARGVILMKTYLEYMNGYYDHNKIYIKGYIDLVKELKKQYDLNSLSSIASEHKKKDFIKLFGTILQQRQILLTFDDFTNNDLLEPREIQDYCSYYQDFYDNLKDATKKDKERILDDLNYNVELLMNYDVGIDYILTLIQKYKESLFADKELLSNIISLINSSSTLRSKKELILLFIESQKSRSIDKDISILNAFSEFQSEKKYFDIKQIIDKFDLFEDKTIKYVNKCFKNGGYLNDDGTEFIELFSNLPSRFDIEKRQMILDDVRKELITYFDKYKF